MSLARITRAAAAGVVLAAAISAHAADPVPSRAHADLLRAKIADIARRGDPAAPQTGRIRTTVTEPEVNSYLAHEIADDLPAGVVAPAVTMFDGGRISSRAVVDLDRVRREIGASSILNPLSYLRGRLPVIATGTLHARDGVARLQFESATVNGVPIPKVLLQQIVSFYSRSERFPSGINLDEPFTLPARIREIAVARGQAVIVQ